MERREWDEDESSLPLRRLHVIASHLNLHADNRPLLPEVCRAGADLGSNLLTSRQDNKLHFSRQGPYSQAFFMRPNPGNQLVSGSDVPDPDAPVTSSCIGFQSCNPLFHKKMHSPPFSKENREYNAPNTTVNGPLSVRQIVNSDEKLKIVSPWMRRQQNSNNNHGFEWQPRMDILESNAEYVVMIELPGVEVNGIRVEVDGRWLVVTGTRRSSANGDAFFHHRELSYGPFRAMWHIPGNTNSDKITAEFMDGFLKLLVPKLVA